MDPRLTLAASNPLATPDTPTKAVAPPDARDLLMTRAKELEASFLAEMLSHSGYQAMQSEFAGGIGEEQFTSFLRHEQAKLMVERGGIGLAEQIFRAMGGQMEQSHTADFSSPPTR